MLASFQKITHQYYQTDSFSVNFGGETEQSRKKINAWVSENTMQKIPELLQPGDIKPLTVMVLVNAIYFKGNWAAPFEEENTVKEPFKTLDGTLDGAMMHHTGDFEYAEGQGLQVLGLPYAGESLYMLIFLPETPEDLAPLEESLEAEFVYEWFRELHSAKVQVALPKFTIRDRFYLLKTLQKMGLNDLSNFSGMAQPSPMLSEVIHEAYIDVNEQGTEAAASTAVMMTRAMVRPREFTADHPFVFCIVEPSTASILFLGRVMDPTQ
jgi:serpin B